MSKCTFGLQPHHIERIESEIKRLSVDEPRLDMTYNRAMWDNLGKEFGWEPFTLCLWYLRSTKNI